MEFNTINEIDGTTSTIIHIGKVKWVKKYKGQLNELKNWKQGTVLNRVIPRLQLWYNMNNRPFCSFWSKMYDRWEPNVYPEWLKELQFEITEKLKFLENSGNVKIDFNSVLINKYLNGNHSIGHHRDNEKIFGDNPTIVSLSFGAPREFMLRRVHFDKENPKHMKVNKREQHLNIKYILEDCSILIMAGSCQKYFSHSVLKDESCEKPRFNLTFRKLM